MRYIIAVASFLFVFCFTIASTIFEPPIEKISYHQEMQDR